tara:strand:+ start:1079 stop:1978 length:900 start_codon:yes stop_codon:yes gene_type:complete
MDYKIIKKYAPKKNIKTNLFFFHVPKCAGLTISHSLSPTLKNIRIFGWSQKYHKVIVNNKNFINDFETKKKNLFNTLPITRTNYTAKNFYSLTSAIAEKYPFIHGHLPFKNYNNLQSRFTFTVLRDPVKRAISNYQFWIQKGFIKKEASIEELYSKKILYPNLITSFFSDKNTPNISEAIRNLKKIDIVTNTENIEQLLRYLISIYDLPNMILLNSNVTQNKIKILEDKVKIFEYFNTMDQELIAESQDLLFDFSKTIKKDLDEEFYSIFTGNKIFNNSSSLIFNEKDLNFVTNTLDKL